MVTVGGLVIKRGSQAMQMSRYIIPIRICTFNQIELPLPRPFLDRFFARDRARQQVVFLEPHQRLYAVS